MQEKATPKDPREYDAISFIISKETTKEIFLETFKL